MHVSLDLLQTVQWLHADHSGTCATAAKTGSCRRTATSSFASSPRMLPRTWTPFSTPSMARSLIGGKRPRGTSENRPMRDTSKPANECEAGQGLLYLAGVGAGNSFSTIRLASIYTGSTWAEDTAPQGCDRSAVQGPERRGRLRPPSSAAILARMR